MDAIRKQASKLREQVAKQQQAVLRQFASHVGNDGIFADEIELQRHEQLERLYTSTRAAKHFQRDIVRGVEGLIAMSLKQMEIAIKLADDCTRYSNENRNPGSATLARAALEFGTSHSTIEKERENLLRTFGVQVSDPLRAMVTSAPLQDARHLTQRYDRIWQDVDAQAAEVLRRQMKLRDSGANTESAMKVQHAESRLEELRSTLSALGKEAIVAMMSVETQQQRVTFQRLLTMVEAEQAFHQTVADILNNLRIQMLAENQHTDSAAEIGPSADAYITPPPSRDAKPNGSHESQEAVSASTPTDVFVSSPSVDHVASPVVYDATPLVVEETTPYVDNAHVNGSAEHVTTTQNSPYYIAEAIQSFDAEAEDELSLSVGDYVVVRQVAPNGWSEGECKGKAGWFPSVYVQRREKAPASKIADVSSSS
ncbi:unnamed protein product [Victoria cruziana]